MVEMNRMPETAVGAARRRWGWQERARNVRSMVKLIECGERWVDQKANESVERGDTNLCAE